MRICTIMFLYYHILDGNLKEYVNIGTHLLIFAYSQNLGKVRVWEYEFSYFHILPQNPVNMGIWEFIFSYSNNLKGLEIWDSEGIRVNLLLFLYSHGVKNMRIWEMSVSDNVSFRVLILSNPGIMRYKYRIIKTLEIWE